MIKTFALALVLVAANAAAEETQDRWNLADLYPTVKAWQDDAAKLRTELKTIAACRGHLGESAQRLQSCLDRYADAGKRFARLEVYAEELLAEDTGVPESLELSQQARVLGAELSQTVAFMRPELLRAGPARIHELFAADKALGIYRHHVDNILRMAPHTLDARGESLVATFDLSRDAAGSVYQILANADMPWPTVRLSDGRDLKLDPSGYEVGREAPNRADRKLVFDTFWGQWKEFERTCGVMFQESLKKDTVYARVRKYPSTLARSLDGERLPVAVYDTLIAETDKGLPTLHRYFRLRARLLGIAPGEMRYYDIYPPLVVSEPSYPLAQGKRMVLEAVKPLGERYVSAMATGFEHRWMDTYPRPHKQSGAHMAGDAYDVHPFVLMNYTGNYESVSTIAHEWGHAMHSYFSNAAQPYINADYATFVAEIASTFNEALLLEHALASARSDDERLLYLGSALEGLRATFFRQAMFADFERDVHARVDRGEPLSGKRLSEIYGQILRRYHGEREGVVKIDDLYTVEWAYIPHFYRAFYVFQYATSIAASSLFAERVLKGEPGARERYLQLISAGGSDYPYELVKRAGVDLATPAPYRAVIARMDRIMDEIEAIEARRGHK
ncbi:MAG TPA: M3 family oligoendopeptidase [Burkholderiales bacterium]|nr:M3 family oligoendopeptidase [Burkholderiales bacterium]